jgi:hypothetical protein
MMASIVGGNKAKKYGKIGIAKANNITYNIEGVYEEDRQKFLALASALNMTFSGNAVSVNGVDMRFDAIEVDQHIHSNKAVLDATEESFTTAVLDLVNDLNIKVADLEARLAAYETHTHEYEDNDGTTTTTKTTQGVN